MPTSEHFKEDELTCHCCGGGIELISPRLLQLLELLRANCGGLGLNLNCAYRCPSHNAELDGSATNSQHLYGTAADIQCPSYLTFGEFKWYVDTCRDSIGGFDGVGYYYWDMDYSNGFIHVDVRYGGVSQSPDDLITWEG